jgi:hypothetical protein
MHALGTNGKSHINPVIDQKRHIVFLGNLVQFPGSFHHDTSVIGFLPVLHHRYACGD